MKRCAMLVAVGLIAALQDVGVGYAQGANASEAHPIAWDGPESLDAVVASPDSHTVLFENEHVRVLEVIIGPGVKEPIHTHQWVSVMLIDDPATLKYYGKEDEVVFEGMYPPPEAGTSGMLWLEPEDLHAVENIDTVEFHAIRVELKSRS